MADRRKLPPDHAGPPVPGGRTRPSLRVKIAPFPAIARRQALNVRLLDGTCAFDTRRDTTKALHDDDLRILLGMARERFSGAQSLLRQQAILALARTKSLDAVEELTALATCPVEHLAARSAAAQALRTLSPSVANFVLETMPPTPAQPDRKRKRRAPARDGSR